jgi:hypothetical protein
MMLYLLAFEYDEVVEAADVGCIANHKLFTLARTGFSYDNGESNNDYME